MITIIILAKNEAIHLNELLPLLQWADKRIVIDDCSTDNSPEICEKYNTKIVQHELKGNFAAQRNFGLRLVTSGWVWFIDADERPDQELIHRVQKIVKSDDQIGYQVRRVDYFLGKQLRYGETKDVWITRLALVGAGVWTGKVHEVWDVHNAQKLPGRMNHYSHDSIQQLFSSVSFYARIRAKEEFDQEHYWNAWQQVAYPTGKFMQNYFGRLGCLDGWGGLMMAVAMSWHSFLVRWNLWTLSWKQRSAYDIALRYLSIVPILLLPFGQLLRGNLTGGGGIIASEVFMILTLGFSFFKVSGKSFENHNRPLFVFSGVLCLSWILSLFFGGEWRAGLYCLRWLIYMFYFLLLQQGATRWLFVSFTGLLQFVGYGLLFGGFTQYILMPDMRMLHWFGWDDHYYRMIGTLFDPNYLGLLLVLFGWWLLHQKPSFPQYVSLGLTLLAIVATYSRTTYLLVLVIGVWMMLKRRAFAAGLMGLFVVFGCLWVLPKPGGEGVNLLRTFSVTARLQSWQMAWMTGWNHPLFGIGFNQYPRLLTPNIMVDFYHPTAPDSSWLYLWATTGLLGVTAFVWMIWNWWKDGSDVVRGSLVLILIHSVTNNSFFYPWVLLWIWLLLLEEKQEFAS